MSHEAPAKIGTPCSVLSQQSAGGAVSSPGLAPTPKPSRKQCKAYGHTGYASGPNKAFKRFGFRSRSKKFDIDCNYTFHNLAATRLTQTMTHLFKGRRLLIPQFSRCFSCATRLPQNATSHRAIKQSSREGLHPPALPQWFCPGPVPQKPSEIWSLEAFILFENIK